MAYKYHDVQNKFSIGSSSIFIHFLVFVVYPLFVSTPSIKKIVLTNVPQRAIERIRQKLNHVVVSPFVITITECVILCTLLRILMKARRVNWTLRLLCVIFHNVPSVGIRQGKLD